ncbi:integrase [Bradyrhizobium sp. PMVTL-01]|uniref:integrase n=1 Tax=Bradyrhizobium sp. PMVTL-01 TaxID=3434999 RepID=UPI003F700E9E
MDTRQKRPQSPGLKWRVRKDGDIPYWFADAAAVKAGYPVKSANLANLAENPEQLIARAQRLQAEMLRWMSGDRGPATRFDGTFKSLLEIYETDSESTFRKVKPHTAISYGTYLRKMTAHIGPRRIDECDGRDVNRWFKQWKESSGLGAARMALAVLKAAIAFGVVCRTKGCADFQTILRAMEFEALPSRTWAPTAGQVLAIRKAAHAAGRPLAALCYAIQFETTLRQWDVIGQWVELDDARPSAVLAYGKKWVGPTWAAIDNNLIMAKVKPTKTEQTTEVTVSFDLSVCPMVCDELDQIPTEKRVGPLVINTATGLPYIRQSWRNAWAADFKAAGLPKGMWNRDLRAGGITEGGKAGASKDDRRKLAGHAKEETTEIYDRDQVEAHRRVMLARKTYREKNVQ